MGRDYLKAFLFLSCASCWHLCEYDVWPFFKILLNTVFQRHICLLVVCLLTSINWLCCTACLLFCEGWILTWESNTRRWFVSEERKGSLFWNVYFFFIHLCWNLAALQSCCSVSQWVSISFIKSHLAFHHGGREIGIYQEIQCRPRIFSNSSMSPLLVNDSSCSQLCYVCKYRLQQSLHMAVQLWNCKTNSYNL